VLVKDSAHRQLTGRGEFEQLTVPVEKEFAGAGAQLRSQQEPVNAELLLCVCKGTP
jgi:hypothetical protein